MLCPIMRIELFFRRFRADTFIKRGVIDSTIDDASSGPASKGESPFMSFISPITVSFGC